MPEPEIFVSDVRRAEAAAKDTQQDVIAKLEAEVERLKAALEAAETRFIDEFAKFKAETHAAVVRAFAATGLFHREAVVKANETLGLHPLTSEDVAGPHGR